MLLQIEQLQQKNISIKGKSSFLFDNYSYKRTAVVSKKVDQKVLKDYEQEANKVIIVEHRLYFSVWKQEKLSNVPKLDETKENLDSFIDQRLKELGL